MRRQVRFTPPTRARVCLQASLFTVAVWTAAGAAHKRGYVARLRAALKQYSEAFLAGAEVSAGIMRDLQAFLAGDVEELPVSLRQLSRLAQSQARPGVNKRKSNSLKILQASAVACAGRQGLQPLPSSTTRAPHKAERPR